MDKLYSYKDIISVISQFLSYKDVKNLLLVKNCDIFDIFFHICRKHITIEELLERTAHNIINKIQLVEYKNIGMDKMCKYGHLEVVKYIQSTYKKN